MIYIHIPFCKAICSYCDFYHTASLAKKGEVVDAIVNEIERRGDFVGSPIRTIYFGGGTPSVLTPSEVGLIIDKIKSVWSLDIKEVTFEANPEDITTDYVKQLKVLGVNRLSMGVQSFCDEHLKIFNRRHDSEQAVRAVEIARQAGIENISIDLIYGMPFLTIEQWRENLKRAVELHVEHISAYHLTIEEKTVLGKRGLKPVADEVSQQHYKILCKTLSEAGFEHYEISNFAKPNRRAIHNSAYWNGTHYLGLGPSAHSYNGKIRHWNVASNLKYLAGDVGESEILTADDIYNERILTSLRTSDGMQGLDKELIMRATKFIENGDLVLQNNKLTIPEDRWLISDYIISQLFR